MILKQTTISNGGSKYNLFNPFCGFKRKFRFLFILRFSTFLSNNVKKKKTAKGKKVL